MAMVRVLPLAPVRGSVPPTKRSLSRAVEILQQVDAPVAGTVLNGIAPGDSYSYGGYGYEAAKA